MFASRKTFQMQTEARFAEIEQQFNLEIDAFKQQLREMKSSFAIEVQEILTRYENHPDERVRFLLNSVSDEVKTALSRSLNDAHKVKEVRDEVIELHGLVEAQTEQLAATLAGNTCQDRFFANLNVTYQAAETGHVSLFFEGSAGQGIALYAGVDKKKLHRIGQMNNIINSYLSTVIRRGEFWMVDAPYDEAATCIWTPFL